MTSQPLKLHHAVQLGAKQAKCIKYASSKYASISYASQPLLWDNYPPLS